MIVKTRYRDIPWEETGCWFDHGDEYNRSCWPFDRGQPVIVRVPAENRQVQSHCVQPRYVVVDENGERVRNLRGVLVSVCSHIAEIGD